jgi:hypothetical protein
MTRKEGRELASPEVLQGTQLKSAVREHMQLRVQRYADEGSAYLPLVTGLLNNLDLIDPNWNEPRDKKVVLSSIGSFCASFHYAHIKAGTEKRNDYLNLFNEPISHTDKWKTIIEDTMSNPEMRADFQANAWREPTTIIPERSIALQYILFHRFGAEPITIADYGAGLHTAVPLLNSPLYKNTYFPHRDELQHFAQDVNVTLALGIDKQKRDEWWAQSSIWPIEDGIMQMLRFSQLMAAVHPFADDKSYPFLNQDVTDPHALRKMQAFLKQRGEQETVDVAISSFLRQFLGNNPGAQFNFENLVKGGLKEGGIWIDIGGENIESYNGSKGSKVNVYEKQGNELIYIETPFILRDQIYIQEVNLSYFGVTHRS